MATYKYEKENERTYLSLGKTIVVTTGVVVGVLGVVGVVAVAPYVGPIIAAKACIVLGVTPEALAAAGAVSGGLAAKFLGRGSRKQIADDSSYEPDCPELE